MYTFIFFSTGNELMDIADELKKKEIVLLVI